MASIIKQLMEWQYYVHVFIIELGLIALMHINSIHYFHSGLIPFGMLFGAIVVMDVVAHTVMKSMFKWKD